MRILFVGDGRSPTALNWIRYFIQKGDEVHLVSTYPCPAEPGLASLEVISAAFSQAVGEVTSRAQGSLMRRMVPVGARTAVRQWLGPLTLPRTAGRLRERIADLQPDLVHAMRIPFEGMMAALAMEEDGQKKIPLVVSVWGNDFTLHARSNPWMARLTQRTLHRADALHTDCQRDQHLALEWGFEAGKPAIVLPGGGGVQTDVFYLPKEGIPEGEPVVINPRGVRAYVRNDTFFRAIPWVLAQKPGVRFLCPAMQGEAQALKWVEKLGIAGAVELLPRQTRAQMAQLYRRAQVALSITTHDGTPNTLLEALACGCFPIAGDIESLREWIKPGVNGLLVDPADPQALAQAILSAFDQPQLLAQARQENQRLIQEKAEYTKIMDQAESFYRLVQSV